MNRRPLWHIMPYRDKNQTVNAPWATPLETFSVESTKRCSFACYVFIFWPLKCQLCFHERKCGDTLRHFKAAQLFLKSLVTSCVLISIENRKRERNETSACVGCKCKSVLFTEKKENATKWRQKMRSHMGQHSDSTVLSYETSLGYLGTSPMACLFTRNKRRWIDRQHLLIVTD